jgi:hypothetical protein
MGVTLNDLGHSDTGPLSRGMGHRGWRDSHGDGTVAELESQLWLFSWVASRAGVAFERRGLTLQLATMLIVCEVVKTFK